MDSFKNLLGGGDNSEKKNDKDKQQNNTDQEDREPLNSKGIRRFDFFADGMDLVKSKVQSKVDEVKADVNSTITKLDDQMKSALKEYQFKINKWVRLKVQEAVVHFMDQARPKVKEAIKDPDMCNFVKNLADDIVDDVWPELMEEVNYQLMMGVSDPFVEIPPRNAFVLLYPCYKFRYWYLYSVDPHDRTIWKKMKTISWWFWTLVSAIPFYGISQFFYVFDFLMRDKEDEFQLVQFILRFKTYFNENYLFRMYFLTQGILKAIIGYFMLYACTTMAESSDQGCTKQGPGASLQEMSEVIGFFAQIFFIWFSFFLLPLSKQKGRPRFLYADERPDFGCCPRGGRIKYFMFYDLFALGAAIGLFFAVWATQESPDFDQTGDFIYFAQICYGLLSFPFLVFNLPFVKDRLTKAKGTAYDRKGNCVPTSKKVRMIYKDDEKKVDKTFLDSMTLDVGEVFDG